ncbi:hypothetical protein ACFX12_002928 [Malus domestica]
MGVGAYESVAKSKSKLDCINDKASALSTVASEVKVDSKNIVVEVFASTNTSNNGKALKVSASVMNNMWIIDSSATEHMTYDSRQVETLKPSTKTVVSVANDNSSHGIGEGTVSLLDTFSLDTDIRTRKTIGYGIRKGKLYYLELTSNSSRMLTQALAVEGNLGDRNKASEI